MVILRKAWKLGAGGRRWDCGGGGGIVVAEGRAAPRLSQEGEESGREVAPSRLISRSLQAEPLQQAHYGPCHWVWCCRRGEGASGRRAKWGGKSRRGPPPGVGGVGRERPN